MLFDDDVVAATFMAVANLREPEKVWASMLKRIEAQ